MNLTIIIILTLIFSAFFSGMEIAFISSNRLRLEINKKHGSFSSKIISVFTNHPSNFITTMLVGNNIALVLYGYFMAVILEPYIFSFTESPVAILILQTVISTLLILFIAEFLPKTLVRINPNGALSIFAVPILLFYSLFYPISQFIIFISQLFLKGVLKAEPAKSQRSRIFGTIDLNFLIQEAQDLPDEYQSEQNEIKLFQNALEFSNIKLRDCLIPRTEIVALEIQSSIEDLRQKFIETGFSKILIYKESIDNIVGYVTSKELFKNPENIESRLLNVSFYPESMPANKLLRRFIQEHKNLAVIVDEFGGIAGMITIEDLIEEIIGEIEDEHDTSELIDKQVSENEFIFSGRMEIDYLNEKYSLKFPESDEYETLAGFIFDSYENIPKLNENIKIGRYEIKILKVSKTKIELVSLKVI
ncbi:MAG: HlyC/CorC family transporter [Bacteroidales bacterium]|nr:HlyC/CorC family transporter [Bacteroidales bacterium]